MDNKLLKTIGFNTVQEFNNAVKEIMSSADLKDITLNFSLQGGDSLS